MRKHPFAIFLLTIAILITGVISFIQSESFAGFLKGFVARHLPSDLGIQANFSDLSIGLFPPSVSIRNPKIELSQHNLINLPPGSTITAKRIDLRFRLFQMFSGNIRINEVAVVDGDVNLVLHAPPEAKKTPRSTLRPQINWDELFQIRAEAVGLENTAIHLRFADSPVTADLIAEQLRLSQWKGRGGLGYELRADLKDINSTVLKGWVPKNGISRLSAIAHVNAQGLQIDDVATLLEGLDIHVSGQVNGNILSAKELPFEARTIVRADLGSLARILAEKEKIDTQGSMEVTADLHGNLLALEETLKAQGRIAGEKVRYEHWIADRLAVEVGYAATGAGRKGEILFNRARIETAEIARSGGHRPGWGGKVEVGSFRYVIGATDPVNVPLKLEHAHINWLGAGVLKDVYPLDTRINGTITATLAPKKDKQAWSMLSTVNLALDEFQLDNQRLGQDKPLRRVLRIRNVKIDGPVAINPKGVTFQNVSLSLPHSHLTVTGGVTGKEGFNITGSGQASLADLGELAETPILGDGSLSVHVHGPSRQAFIDFDADLKDAEYLRLKLGNFSGRITWDDDSNFLIFDHVRATKGQTNYGVDGKLDLGKSETADLNVAIPGGNILDLTQIFENFTKDFWWFPRTLAGPVKGSAKVTGGLSMSQLVVTADLTGNDWESLGERFRIVSLKGGYDKGKYQITDIHGVKQSGKFAGHISYDTEKRFDWDLRTQDLQVTDLDHLARLDVPVRGRIQFETHGSGKEETLVSSLTGALTDFSVRGFSYPPSRIQIKTDNGVATGTGNAFGNEASFDFTYGMRPGTPSNFRADAAALDFSPVILLINPRLMQDPNLRAHTTGSVKLGFKSGAIELGSGSMTVSDYVLGKSGTEFHLVHPVSVKMTDGYFAIRDLALAGPSSTMALNLQGKPSGMDGTVSGAIDLQITEFVVSTIDRASGAADLDLTIGGALKDPKIYGTAEIDAGTLRIPAVESPFENVTGTLQLRQNVVAVQNLQSDLGGGRVRMGGTITLFPDRWPTLALKGELSGTRIRVYPFQYVKVRGTLGVNGEERPYLVDGSLVVDSALSREKMLGAKQEQGLRSLQYTPSTGAQGNLEQPLFKLKIDVVADHGILVQNDLFDAEVKAKVTVVNTLDAPRIIGTADLIQGKMKFKDRVFQIQSANAVFDNPNVINPQFNLSATTDVSNTKINFYVSGRMNKWKVDLTSNPAMTESEILSLLALGNTPASGAKISGLATNQSAVQQGEAASLLLQSLDFNREVEEKTGFEVQLDQYENTIQGQSIFSRNVETTVAPKIVVKRRIGDRVTLSYGSTVGVDVNKQTEANAELHLTNAFSVLGVWDTYEFNDLQQKKDSQSSYGFDLKIQKRFR